MRPNDPFRMDGQVALVTGGATGLGFAMARSFVDAGARVILVGRREKELAEAADALGSGKAIGIVSDITRTKDAEDLVSRAEDWADGPISTLVNNAGKHAKAPSLEVDDEEFLSVFQVHVAAAMALSRSVARRQLPRGEGHILFVASMASLIGLPRVAAYAAAKSALLGLVRTLACEWSPGGVRVNAIAPGWMETPMLRKAMEGDPQRRDRILSRTPIGRFGSPEDVAHAATYLSSPAARFVTGTCLVVDGGASIGF